MIHFVNGQAQAFGTSNFKAANIYDALDYCSDRAVVGVDTETQGQFDHKNKMIMFQIGDHEHQYVIDVRNIPWHNLKELQYVLGDPTIIKIFWNAKFDLKFLRMHGFDTKCVHDGFLAEKALWNGIKDHGLSLADAVQHYGYGVQLDKDTRGSFPQGSSPFTARQIEYGAYDVKFLPGIRDQQLEQAEEWGMVNEMTLENYYIEAHADMEYIGFNIDTEKWLSIENDKQSELEEVRENLDDYVVRNGHTKFIDPQGDLFTDKPKSTIKWSSQKQVVEFCQHIGLDTKVEDRSKESGYRHSVEEGHIRKFKKEFPEFVPLFLKFQELNRLVTTYGKQFLLHVNKRTGRIHSDFFPFINTGRLSSSSPNMQNIPNEDVDPQYRECFKAKDGMQLVVADYSQQEPRITADRSGDSKLIDFFTQGDGDTHSLVASIISPLVYGEHVDVKKKKEDDAGNVIQEGNDPHISGLNMSLRAVGKMVNLGLDYGKSAYSLKDDLNCSQDWAQQIIDKIAHELPGKEEYFNQKKREALNKGFITIDKVTGRKFFIDTPYFKTLKELEDEVMDKEWLNMYGKEKRKNTDKYKNELRPKMREYMKKKGSIERDAMNYPIQGTGASMIKWAAVLIRWDLEQLGYWYDRARIIMILHDEIVAECDSDIAEEVSDIMKRRMEEAGELFCKRVPQLAEPVITKHWTH